MRHLTLPLVGLAVLIGSTQLTAGHPSMGHAPSIGGGHPSTGHAPSIGGGHPSMGHAPSIGGGHPSIGGVHPSGVGHPSMMQSHPSGITHPLGVAHPGMGMSHPTTVNHTQLSTNVLRPTVNLGRPAAMASNRVPVNSSSWRGNGVSKAQTSTRVTAANSTRIPNSSPVFNQVPQSTRTVVAAPRGPRWGGTGRPVINVVAAQAFPPIVACPTGMQIATVTADGPAAVAGLCSGDVILGVNGVQVCSFDDVQTALASTGDEVPFTVLRADSGEVQRICVRPQDHRIGVAIEPVDVDVDADAGVQQAQAVEPAEPVEYGMLIDEIIDGGQAALANLRVGDIIVWMDEKRTQSFEEVQQALRDTQGEIQVVFINGENNKLERLTLKPVGGRMGAMLHAVEIK